jgi:cytochrome c oxidase cbb3-type subunit 3
MAGRSLRLGAPVIVWALVGLGCTDMPGQPAVTAAPALADVPIGPLPGPEEHPSAAPNPLAGDSDALEQGRRFFVWYNCAGCHGDHGGGGMGPSLRDDMWIYGDSPEQIANSIVEGRALGMPAWGAMLTDAQVWQLTRYISALRTPDEPDPPAQ